MQPGDGVLADLDAVSSPLLSLTWMDTLDPPFQSYDILMVFSLTPPPYQGRVTSHISYQDSRRIWRLQLLPFCNRGGDITSAFVEISSNPPPLSPPPHRNTKDVHIPTPSTSDSVHLTRPWVDHGTQTTTTWTAPVDNNNDPPCKKRKVFHCLSSPSLWDLQQVVQWTFLRDDPLQSYISFSVCGILSSIASNPQRSPAYVNMVRTGATLDPLMITPP